MEIKFKRDTSFRKQFFVPDSFAHPAKMDAQLLIWLTENYTNVGEVILDPMAGSGTTMLACTLGRNVILVELERKFCLMMEGGDCNGFECALCNQRMEWEAIETEEEFLLLADKQFPKNKQLEIAFTRYGWEWTRNRILHRYPQGEHHIVGNWEQVKQRPQFEGLGGVLGGCQIIQGDARNLEGLLADKIITSPPYAEQVNIKDSKQGKRRERLIKAGYNPDDYMGGHGRNLQQDWSYTQADKIITSPPYAEGGQGVGTELHPERMVGSETGLGRGYSENKENIGNLPYGDIDKIITSPPYAEAVSGGGIAKYGHYSDPELAQRAYSAENMNIKKQIKRVEEGKAKMKRPDVFTSEGNKAAKGFFEGNYSRDPENIGNLPYGNIDKIITSPPYEEAHDKKIGGLTDTDRPDLVPYSWVKTDDPQNIGNLKGDTYLEAMALVYAQCFTVLKDGGLLILVTKNFIRNRQVIRLDSDTIKLCEQAGFGFVERHFRRLPAQSFWRTIYQQKYPDVEVIQNEDILVFRKLIADKGRD